MPGNHALSPVPFNHVKGSFEPTRECKYELNHCYVIRCIFHETKASFGNYSPSEMYFRLCPIGYKKAHSRHLPVVLTHSTLETCFHLVQRANRRDENCDDIFPFALPNDVMFKI